MWVLEMGLTVDPKHELKHISHKIRIDSIEYPIVPVLVHLGLHKSQPIQLGWYMIFITDAYICDIFE